MEEEKKEEQNAIEKIKINIEKKLEELSNLSLQSETIDKLSKLIDIHKDIKNEEFWEKEEDNMRNYGEYGNYEGSYGRRGVAGTGRGRYRAGDNYGRRGVDSKYRGEEIMDNMYRNYQDYSDEKEMYGADNKTMESFKYMVKSFKDYYKHLKENASSQEEVQILDEAIDEMARM